MTVAGFGKRFLDTTRGQIVSLVRRGVRTVEELAQALGLTDNAVRNHLATLERDGIVQQEGVRRGQGAGKPAVLYEVRPEAEPLFSRAYPPVLATMADVLVTELPAADAERLLREVGRRMASSVVGQGGRTLEGRARAAADFLNALGGDVDVQVVDGAPRLQGHGCPLSAAVARRPEVCRAVETLVAEIIGAPVRQCCAHGARPSCCFAVARSPITDA
jgi:predicted ArsR family transcriptional regulator